MAHSLTISIGATTITLEDFRYTPRTPEPDDETITETVVLTQAADIGAVVQALNRAFNQARTYRKVWSGDPVYVNFTPDGYPAAYRSEIFDGRVTLDDETLGYRWLNASGRATITWTRRAYWEGSETQLPVTNWHNEFEFEAEIADPSNVLSGYANITGVVNANSNAGRLYFSLVQGGFANELDLTVFADEALTQQVAHIATAISIGVQALIADNGSGLGGTITIDQAATAAVAVADWSALPETTVYNYQDATHDNFVEIAAADIEGDLPAPIRVAMENTLGGGADDTLDIFMGQHVQGAAGELEHHLEFAAADVQGGNGAEVSESDAGGGAYLALDWTGTAETLLGRWTLASAGGNTRLQAMAGETFMTLLRTFGIPAVADIWLRWTITDVVTLTTLWAGAWTRVETVDAVQQIGDVRVPPRKLLPYFDTTELYLNLYGKRSGAGNNLLDVDFFQFWARVRRLRTGNSIPTGAVLHDDQIENIRALDNGSGVTSISAQVPLAGPTLLEPGHTQRLYFLQIDTDHAAAINRSLKIGVWYRPRRVTL